MLQVKNSFSVREKPIFVGEEGKEEFWLGIATSDVESPGKKKFHLDWLSTFPFGHPLHQQVENLALSLDFKLNQIFVEYGEEFSRTKVRSSSVLATGVKLSRMTEPGESEWWKLGAFTRKALESLRKSWGSSDNFLPRIFPLVKPRNRMKKQNTTAVWAPLPPSLVTKVFSLLKMPFFDLIL